MQFKTLLSLVAVGLVTAAPTGTDSAAQPKTTLGKFDITDFYYECTGSYCSWTFSATDPVKFKDHPAVNHPINCAGNNTANTIFEYHSCTNTGVKDVTIEAFVHTAQNGYPAQLRLQYHHGKPMGFNGQYFFAFGPNVNTTANGQAANFVAPETYRSSG